MHDSITWVGMDVHAENIVVAAIGDGSETVRARWETPNTNKGLERLSERLKEFGDVRCVYEAGPCGYGLRRFLEDKGIRCDVAAPSLIPRNPGGSRQDGQKGRGETGPHGGAA